MPHRVLVADDDRAIRESLARALDLEGYDVVTVVDGVEALTRSRRDAFDALVVDVMMPGVDGLAVCRVLRAEGDRTPVLMLTARVETPDRVAGLDAGADDYLPKPIELDELLARLRALLRRAAAVPTNGAGRPDAVLQTAALRLDPAARRAEFSPEARERLIDDLQGETRELSHLVDELVELALSRRSDEPEEPVDLAELGRRTAQQVHVDADESVVRGHRQGLERAVGNLLENAAKFDEHGVEPIELRVRQGTITVSDRGPGVDAADAARVFDRFYRADSARSLPGSGLGLAIVRDVAEVHGGTVFARPRTGGGAEVGFAVDAARLLPVSEPDHVEDPPRSITVADT